MKEPILSREEVDKLADCCFIQSNQLTPHQWRSFAERLESALLEKLCGEPVAWRAPNLSGSGGAWAYRDADDRFEDQHGQPVGEPLYALNRRKA